MNRRLQPCVVTEAEVTAGSGGEKAKQGRLSEEAPGGWEGAEAGGQGERKG